MPYSVGFASVIPLVRAPFMISFLHSFFTMKAYLPEFCIEKLLLDSVYDTCPVYEYCRYENITPFIDLNSRHICHFTYNGDFTINKDGVSICKMSLRMHKNGDEATKHQVKYGRTVHIFTDDNLRLFNILPRDSRS